MSCNVHYPMKNHSTHLTTHLTKMLLKEFARNSEFPPKLISDKKLDPSQGLGVVRYYKTVKHYTHHGWTYTTEKVLEKGSDYDPKSKFTVYIPSSGKFASESVHHYKIEFIEQYFNGGSEMDAIGSFVLDESNGFTQPGISRINDSIRTFVWAILGAQGQARTSILGTGKAFDAQKQFLANVEDSVNSAVDLPSSIERYQSTLQYARSKVDFAVGLGLYMVPSDMDLHIGTVNGYNNLIVIASSDDNIQLGRNDAVNEQVIIPQETFESPPDDFEDSREHEDVHTPTEKDDTPAQETFESPPDDFEDSREHEDVHTPTEKDDTPAKKQDNSLTPVQEKLTHDENKLIMTLGGISIISSAIYFLK